MTGVGSKESGAVAGINLGRGCQSSWLLRQVSLDLSRLGGGHHLRLHTSFDPALGSGKDGIVSQV